MIQVPMNNPSTENVFFFDLLLTTSIPYPYLVNWTSSTKWPIWTYSNYKFSAVTCAQHWATRLHNTAQLVLGENFQINCSMDFYKLAKTIPNYGPTAGWSLLMPYH